MLAFDMPGRGPSAQQRQQSQLHLRSIVCRRQRANSHGQQGNPDDSRGPAFLQVAHPEHSVGAVILREVFEADRERFESLVDYVITPTV